MILFMRGSRRRRWRVSGVDHEMGLVNHCSIGIRGRRGNVADICFLGTEVSLLDSEGGNRGGGTRCEGIIEIRW